MTSPARSLVPSFHTLTLAIPQDVAETAVDLGGPEAQGMQLFLDIAEMLSAHSVDTLKQGLQAAYTLYKEAGKEVSETMSKQIDMALSGAEQRLAVLQEDAMRAHQLSPSAAKMRARSGSVDSLGRSPLISAAFGGASPNSNLETPAIK
jgi:hypothetical protein